MKLLILCLISLFALAGSLFSHATETSFDPCFYAKNQSSSECRNKYSFDTLTLYFRDAANLEQTVFAKRVLAKATGAVVHVNYDFQMVCQQHCDNIDIATDEFMWAFRNAIVEDRLYTKAVTDKATPKHKGEQPAPLEQRLPLNKAFTNIMNNLSSMAANGALFKQAAAEKTLADQPYFFVRKIGDSGLYVVYRLINKGELEVIDGTIRISDTHFSADLSHSMGYQTNEELRNFINDYWIFNRGLYCSSSIKCKPGQGDVRERCETVMRCEMP